jgi:hypothetical protein
MRIRRSLIIPAILTISMAGSLLTVPAMSVVAGPVASVHVTADGSSASPQMFYHG